MANAALWGDWSYPGSHSMRATSLQSFSWPISIPHYSGAGLTLLSVGRIFGHPFLYPFDKWLKRKAPLPRGTSALSLITPLITSLIFASWWDSTQVRLHKLCYKCGDKLALSSVQFSHSVMSDYLWPHGLQHARLPCRSPMRGACSDSCPSSWWCHPTISSSVIPFSSCLQSFPALGSIPLKKQVNHSKVLLMAESITHYQF